MTPRYKFVFKIVIHILIINREITFQGEWSQHIYQVPNDYKIKYKCEYYKIPNKAKMIADIGYVEIAGKQLNVFISNGMMHFTSRSIECTENWDTELNSDRDSTDEIDFLDTEVAKDFLTIILKEDLDGKSFKDEVYPGNAGAVHHEIYTQVY